MLEPNIPHDSKSSLKGPQMKTSEFHEPFIKSLFIIGTVTLLLLLSTPILVGKLYSLGGKNQQFTTIKSEIISDSKD